MVYEQDTGSGAAGDARGQVVLRKCSVYEVVPGEYT